MSTEKLLQATKSIVVTPSDAHGIQDTADSNKPITTRGISIMVTGTIVYKDDSEPTPIVRTIPSGMAVGVIHPIKTNWIMAASTATGIVAWW